LKVAPAVDLVQFYCSSLIGKIALQKFEGAEQQWIVCRLAQSFNVATEQGEDSRLLSLRRVIVDACPYLLEVFDKPPVSDDDLVATYGIFLRACLKRTEQSSWVVPSHVLKVLQDFQKRPEIKQNKEYESIIRSLTPSNQTPESTPLQLDATPSASRPPKSSTLSSRAPRSQTTSASPGPVKSTYNQPISTVQGPIGIKRDINLDILARPVKRTRVEETSSTTKAPTLLSRLGTSISRQSSLPELSLRTQSTSPKSQGDPSAQPSRGFSIKGAAAKQTEQNGDSSSRVITSSLLERLQDPHAEGSERPRHGMGRRRNM